MSTPLHPAFTHSSYHFRRRFATLVGSRIDVTNPAGERCLHCHQKAFRLREDIRLYNDDQHTEELLAIQTRNIIDFSAAYDVWDQTRGEYVGTLRRKGWTSLVRDLWEFTDQTGMVHAQLQEDSAALAMIRRFVTNWIPQRFNIVSASGQLLARCRQHFNPLVYKMDMELLGGPQSPLDPRMALAAATLVIAIEKRQT